WLIGPIGAGFIYAKKEVIPQIDTRFLGWWSVQDMKKFEYAQRVPFSDAKKFEVGSPAMIAYVGLRQSLRVLLEIPAKEREQAAVDNANHLRKLLSERSIEYYDFPDENLSPIVSCAPRDVEELNKELNKNHIYCSVRNGRLRVSPHFYNTRTEIETVVEMMR
ncbi:MAG: aminotransferase class V-fold PLP-dependent enzyme, partial [Candidatus Thorarchaeota archaeon]|nr:aminotransferase class V-fold PLP-dependent enzyme [Candidatus Thorarchaeota archaeon]